MCSFSGCSLCIVNTQNGTETEVIISFGEFQWVGKDRFATKSSNKIDIYELNGGIVRRIKTITRDFVITS